MNDLNILSIFRRIKVLGPGIRYVVWTQGCHKDCINCSTPEGKSTAPNHLISVESLAQDILKTPDLEGLTLSGGEPFIQSEQLCRLVNVIKQKRDLSIIIYTGFTLGELRLLNDEFVENLLSATDVLIDGEYIEELNDNLGLRGSANQTVHFLTDRYKDRKHCFEKSLRHVEIKNDWIIGVKPKGLDKFIYKMCHNAKKCILTVLL